MPKLLDEMQDVAGRVDQVAEDGMGEIEKLGAMQKLKATKGLPGNVSLSKAKAEAMPKQAEELKAELENLKQAGELVKEKFEGEEFKEGCKKLKETPQPDARASYREIFGKIPFTDEEWTSWTAIMDKKKIKYEPKDYDK